MGQDDKKIKMNWFYLKKIVLGAIREGCFLYIFLLNLITSPVLVATVFFYQFLDPPNNGIFLLYIALLCSILAIHALIRWLTFILVPSAPS